MKNKLFFVTLFSTLFWSLISISKEIEVYADSINYDSNNNIVAKGNAKVIDQDRILTSNIIIINKDKDKINLPKEFQYKDEKDNYYYGSSGEFTTDFVDGQINDIKILLNDGSRLVGHTGYKTGKQDLIDKGVFSPCESKINIKNFICPIWQIEGEKILHDRDNLFIHTKHAKMRIFNTPIYYFPYIVAPSPLRKERKSGFLTPSVGFMFLGTKRVQSISTPYYFVIGEDKELLLTPTVNYGGGVDASQNITYEYNQLLSGGKLSINASTDTNLENSTDESWLRDASVITNINQNLNEKYWYELNSAFQTSPTYIRRSDQNNLLNRKNTLNTSFNLYGYDTIERHDTLYFNISSYQIVRNDEDNKTTPTSLPYIKYISGPRIYRGNKYKNYINFYNIFRDLSTDEHAKQQEKIGYNLKSKNESYSFFSKFTFKTELHAQAFNIENKKNGDYEYTGTYGRIFPMTGFFIETPILNKKNNILFTPKIFGIFNTSQSNSNKISNEDSSDYKFGLGYYDQLNRYSGTDKLDNSKRLGYGIILGKDKYKLDLGQSYELDIKRNDFSKNAGLYDHMSDLLGIAKYEGPDNQLTYDFRFNVDQGLLKASSLSLISSNILGKFTTSYSQDRKEVNTILKTGSESLNLIFKSKEFFDYSSITSSAFFDLVKDDPVNYKAGYQYLDECFGLNLDFERSFFEDRDLKPKDKLILMFSFKFLGSYTSTNLAVSEIDKQDIRWETDSVDEKKFK